MTRSVRRFRLALPAFLLSAALAACDESTSTLAPSADTDLARKVAAMGFDATTMVVRGDRVIVEGDIILKKSDVLATPDRPGPDGPRFQYATTNRATSGFISVNFSAVGSQSSAWQTAVANALTKWNSVPGANIYMSSGSGGYGGITISFGQCDGGSGVVACATFPAADGTVGPIITIDSDFKNQLSSSEKLMTMVHEIGHTLGFRHTNWNNRCAPYTGCSEDEAPFGAEHITGTPTSPAGGAESDPSSVMNAVVVPWTGFSYYDRVATRVLFPGGPGPFPSHTLASSRPVLNWTAMQDAVSYEVYFVHTDWQPFWSTVTRTYVGTTSGTTYTDYSRSFTQVVAPGNCPIGPNNYVIRANFSDGSQSGDSYGNGGCYN
jgi:hypothetical protein